MQALKALVIVLGVLILAAAAVVAVTIYNRATEGLEGAGSAAGFGVKQMPLPAGAELEDMTASGERLVLRVRMADGSRRIMVVDLATGAPLGELDFTPAP